MRRRERLGQSARERSHAQKAAGAAKTGGPGVSALVQQQELTQSIYRALAKTMYLAIGVAALLLFLDAITVILLLFITAFIVVTALSPVVTWLEDRRWPRALAVLAVFGAIGAVFTGLGFLVVPRIGAEVNNLVEAAPKYTAAIQTRLNEIIHGMPALEKQIQDPELMDKIMPSAGSLLARVGRYSLSVVGLIAGFIVFLTITLYMLVSPRPLLKGMLMVVPPKMREDFTAAFAKGSEGILNWAWANALIGAVEAVITSAFLAAIGIPGALIWGLVAFFSELIPQLGSYIMAIPPLIVALALDPGKAIWVLLFYIGMQQLVNTLLAPNIRARTMNIHPVSEIFTLLALTAVFGILGAMIASPVVVFFKAFYNQFYTKKNPEDPADDERVEGMLRRRAAVAGEA